MHFSPEQAAQAQVTRSQVTRFQVTRSQVTRAGLLFSCLAIAALTACTPSGPSVNAVSNDSSTIEASPEASLTADSKAKSSASKGSAKDQFTAIIGSKQDGWLPKAIAGKGLKKGLTPAATGKIFPGAEKVSEFGFSKIKAEQAPGLHHYEFYYAKDSSGKPTQLQSVRLQFEPSMNEAYADLVKVASNKYGPTKPQDVKEQIITWVGPNFVTAQITKPPTDFSGYQLEVTLEEQ